VWSRRSQPCSPPDARSVGGPTLGRPRRRSVPGRPRRRSCGLRSVGEPELGLRRGPRRRDGTGGANRRGARRQSRRELVAIGARCPGPNAARTGAGAPRRAWATVEQRRALIGRVVATARVAIKRRSVPGRRHRRVELRRRGRRRLKRPLRRDRSIVPELAEADKPSQAQPWFPLLAAADLRRTARGRRPILGAPQSLGIGGGTSLLSCRI
jgi:hypothetical protein